jgi:hypothetical protein
VKIELISLNAPALLKNMMTILMFNVSHAHRAVIVVILVDVFRASETESFNLKYATVLQTVLLMLTRPIVQV